MRRAETGAFYIILKMGGLKFYRYNVETKEKGLTSCPHDATLFTSSGTAYRHADKLRRDTNQHGHEVNVSVLQTRTHAPNVISGG